MRILVVDDDPAYTDMIGRVLRGDGHDVTFAMRGAEAIQRALTDEFDVLLCDLMLPDLGGTEVIRALKAQSPDLPVIVISALAPDRMREPCLDAGATGYIQKPLHLDDLRAELKMVEAGRADLTVWLVDPDPIHRRRTALELQAHGCAVLDFESGTALLGSEAQAGLTRPDLVLLEADDPAAHDLMERAAGVPTMAFAGHIEPKREEDLLRAGAAICMKKPLDTSALLVQARFLAHG